MSKNKETNYTPNRLQRVSLPAEISFHVLLAVFCAFCIIPFIFVVIISFSAEESIRTIGYSFHPTAWSFDAYRYVIKLGRQLWVSYFNSFYVTILGTALSLFFSVLYAYALYRKDFKFKSFFTMFAFFTTLFGGGLAPTFMVCKQLLGLNDNYAALIVPALISPFNIIILRTFLKSSIPEELIEAAAIDGSSEYKTLFRIVLPLAKPGLATVGLLTALSYWNEWQLAMLYIKNANRVPLQYLLMKMQNQSDFLLKNAALIGTEASKMLLELPGQSLRMALVVFIVVPIAFAYPFFQRYIISGLTIGSVKG